MTPNIELVYHNGEFNIPKRLLPETGIPQAHHFQSTDGDNLIELAGRVCYDSCKSTTKTRGSAEYHKHINEVKHGSVQGHLNLCVHLWAKDEDVRSILECLVNRPGFYTHINTNWEQYIEITFNIRAVNDWFKFGPGDLRLYNTLVLAAKDWAPCATAALEVERERYSFYPYNHENSGLPQQIWLSFYIGDISRGCSHEWVRHGFHTAISQRSTRYVDESESQWAWHPLIQKYQQKIHTFIGYTYTNDNIEKQAKEAYVKIVNLLDKELTTEGVDKFSARKQARGAARGILGNALSTELIWSASLDEIKEIIRQRANSGADAEIRLLANKLYEIVEPLYPEYFKGVKGTCPDGIGYEVIFNEKN